MDEKSKQAIQKAIQKAIDKAIELNSSEELDQLLDAVEKYEKDLAATLEEGKSLGRKEGVKEEKMSNAKKLYELGVDIDIIIKATGLTKEEIEKL